MTVTPSYVGFWPRFMAFLLDSLIASICLYPLSLLFDPALATISDPMQARQMLDALLVQMLLEIIVIGAAFIAFWHYFGASPCKMLFKGTIVDAETLGPASRNQLLIRYLGYYVSLLPLGLGFFWIGFDKRKQGWHDKLAGTLVVTPLSLTGHQPGSNRDIS